MNLEEYKTIFRPQAVESLRMATHDLSWLLSRGYMMTSSLNIVGDRYRLHRAGRAAVKRAAIPDLARAERAAREVREPTLLQGATVWIDGFNILITVERALRGDPILRCRDGVIRDIAGVHGTYRRGRHTRGALELIGAALRELEVGETLWLFDQPVSNSGRAAELARHYGEARVVADPDQDLIHAPDEVFIISGDGEVIERSSRWFNLIDHLISREYVSERAIDTTYTSDTSEGSGQPWLIDLSGQDTDERSGGQP